MIFQIPDTFCVRKICASEFELTITSTRLAKLKRAIDREANFLFLKTFEILRDNFCTQKIL